MVRTQEQQQKFNKNRRLKVYNLKISNVLNRCSINSIMKHSNINNIDIDDIDDTIRLLKDLKAAKIQKLKLENLGVLILSEEKETPESEQESDETPESEQESDETPESEQESDETPEKRPKKRTRKRTKKRTKAKLSIPKAILHSKHKGIITRYTKLHNQLVIMVNEAVNITDDDRLTKLNTIKEQVIYRLSEMEKLA
jgi:hypothetical protein